MTKAIRKYELQPTFKKDIKPEARGFLVWDARQGGLALCVQPSGHMSWKAIYNYHGKTRWYTIGRTEKIGLAEARKITQKIMGQVALGQDPQGEKKEAARRASAIITFEMLAAQYVEQHARTKNRSWRQADYLVRKHVLPRWRGKDINTISRADVNALFRGIKAPVV